MPAPDGPNTLVEALYRLKTANIELADIALRRPSLDEVFFALTTEKKSPEPKPVDHRNTDGQGERRGGRHRADGNDGSPASRLDAGFVP
jgi:ABC-2 type transport system ATP-binding protein